MSFVRARLSFAILRASVLCVRGAWVKWRTFTPIDGASIDEINFYAVILVGLGQFFLLYRCGVEESAIRE